MKIFSFLLLLILSQNIFSKKILKKISRNIGRNLANSIRDNYDQTLISNNDEVIYLDEDNFKDKKLITISPGGLRGFYELGVCKFLKEQYNFDNYIFSGASSGSWSSLFMCKKKDDSEFLETIQKINYEEFNEIYNIEQLLKYEILKNYKTSDFSLEKLFIGVTIINKCKLTTNIYSDFDSLTDAIDCCIASSHIPFITGRISHKYKGQCVLDGGFSKYPYLKVIQPTLHISPSIWDRSPENFMDFNDLNLKQKNINKILYDYFQDGYHDSFIYNHKIKNILTK